MDEARDGVRLRLTEDLARVGAGEEQHFAGARDGDVGQAAFLLDAGGVADAVHMREQRLLHARHEHAVELQALRGVHRHHGDRLAVLVHGVEIGAQAHPLQKVGQRIAAQHAHGLGGAFAFPALLACRGSCVVGVLLVVSVHELVDYGQELLDVLNAPARLVGVFCLQGADQARLVDDGLDALAQVT